MKDAHNSIRKLTWEVKEQTEISEELRATFNKASSEMQSFKKTLNFRLNLAKSREEKLISDLFKNPKSSKEEI